MNELEQQTDTNLRQDLMVRLDGIQGTLAVSAEDHGDDGTVVWITPVADGDNEDGVSIGVAPKDLRAAISFVLGEIV